MPRSKFIAQLFLPEMRGFWLVLLPLVILNIIIFFQLSSSWGLIVLAVSLVILILIFFTNLKSARSRFQLVSERNQIQAIIANFTSPIIAYDQDFLVTAFNGAAEEFFNIKQEEVAGKKISPDWAKNEKTKVLAMTIFPSLAPSMVFKSDSDKYPQVVELSFPSPFLEITVTTVRVKDPLGNILGFFKIIRDRTREEELLAAKSDFLTVTAHQLRTPLSAIRWTFESLLKGDFGDVSETQREAINTGLEAAEKVLKTANDLLDAASIESGKFGYDFADNNIIDLAKELIETYQLLAGRHNIKIYLEVPEGETGALKFDALRIKLVLQNLVENAIRYNVENGEVVIKLERKDSYMQISVSDTGIGIPAEEIPKLFSKFFRASNVMKYETEGTGLGLYVAKNIVEAHKGRIWAESVENRGATFYFTLPLGENSPAKSSDVF